LALFSVVAIAAIVSGVILIPQMAKATTDSGDTSLATQATNTTADTAVTQEANELALPSWNNNCDRFGMRGMRFERHGFGGFGPVEVSDEFKQTVVNIAENDTDVQNLMNDGYNVTATRPVIKTVIDAEGNVVTKATSAVLILQKDTTGYATVKVNIDESKVSQIVILTRTVIDKP
jgi:hypothetical protein